MLIDGKVIANGILDELKQKIRTTSKIPVLRVVLVGDDPASVSYIRQKRNAADYIGAIIQTVNLPPDTTDAALSEHISRANSDPQIHGLIIQRPLPDGSRISPDTVSSVIPSKDVDGFVPDSVFETPVALAVVDILRQVRSHMLEVKSQIITDSRLFSWLKNQTIVILGKGQTAGLPVARYFRRHNCATSIISTGTADPKSMMSEADILISCVGKPRIIKRTDIKKGVILLSVGLSKDDQGKLRGDYDTDEISDIAAWYTPTPGGVGPVNVACLMRNLVKSTEAAV